jgi:hypothetical protein
VHGIAFSMVQSSLNLSCPVRVLLVLGEALGNRSLRFEPLARFETERPKSGFQLGPASRPDEFRGSIPSSSSIRSPSPLLLLSWLGSMVCEAELIGCRSLRPDFARAVIFLTQPSTAPPILSRLVELLEGTVDEFPLRVSKFGEGCFGARFGRCCAKNLLSPSMAGPGMLALRSRVPTPVPENSRPLCWRLCRPPGLDLSGIRDAGEPG